MTHEFHLKMTAERRLADLKTAALEALPIVQHSHRLDEYLPMAKALFEKYCQYDLTEDASNTFVFGVRFVQLMSGVQAHPSKALPAYRTSVAMLERKANVVLDHLGHNVKPRLLKQLELVDVDGLAEVVDQRSLESRSQDVSRSIDADSGRNPAVMAASKYPSFSAMTSSAASSPGSSYRFPTSGSGRPSAPPPDAGSSFASSSTMIQPASTAITAASSYTRPGAHSTSTAAAAASSAISYPRFGYGGGASYATGIPAAPSSSYIQQTSTFGLAPAAQPALAASSSASNSAAPTAGPTHASHARQPSYAALRQVLSGVQPTASLKMHIIHVPDSIINTFLMLAQRNTVTPPRGIETCGVLCGREIGGAYFVTHLVLPRQKGEADSCEMLNEEDLIDIAAREGVITLGWIHTHPSQECFMSSMDLHTHLSYQLMLPEAIAIVLAPMAGTDGRGRCAVYRLTDSSEDGSTLGGLELIQSCELRGFHPHPDNIRIFEECQHLVWDRSVSDGVNDGPGNGAAAPRLKVLDLR